MRRAVLQALSVVVFLLAGSLSAFAGQPQDDVPCVNTGTSCIALNPDVTPATIANTICVPHYTRTVRPSSNYITLIKDKLIRDSGLSADMILDHIIPLALGGHPRQPSNLQLQEASESRRKDRIELKLRCLVCSGQVSLDDARTAIAANWEAAYHQYATVKCHRIK